MTTTTRPYPDVNQVAIVGRLTEAPRLKTVGAKQTPLAELTVYVNNPNGQPSVIDIQVWAGGATAVHKFTNKDDQIIVTGRLRTDTYTDRNGEHTRVYIDAGTNGVQFTGQRTNQPDHQPTA